MKWESKASSNQDDENLREIPMTMNVNLKRVWIFSSKERLVPELEISISATQFRPRNYELDEVPNDISLRNRLRHTRLANPEGNEGAAKR